MNLTEPQAGSDLAALRARAERPGDGTYRIFGQKIFITYGEHDLTDNIVHLVLARLPDAPAGTRGISLFLVPKRLVEADGRSAPATTSSAPGIEHKLGIHGSPTCTMVVRRPGRRRRLAHRRGEQGPRLHVHDDEQCPARRRPAGRRHRRARLPAGARLSPRERRQGRAPGWTGEGMSPIIEHPDVRRMLLEMKAKTVAARGPVLPARRGDRPRPSRAGRGEPGQAASRAPRC